MVRDSRGAILNPGAQISKAGAEFMPPGEQYWAPRGWIFLTMLAPRSNSMAFVTSQLETLGIIEQPV